MRGGSLSRGDIPRSPAAQTTTIVTIDGVPIAYQAIGHGEPVVLVHGLSGSGRWWQRNVTALGQSFRVYVVDLIGFGASRGPRHFVLSEASDYLVRWLDVLGIERTHVIGHSMGGFIAADMAADHPRRVSKLVLVDAAILPRAPGLLRNALGLLKVRSTVPISFWPILITDAIRCGPITLWEAARDVLQADLRPKLRAIDAPTLVVWGDHDRLVPLDHGCQLVDLIRASRLAILPGAGHNPMWDRPDQFNPLVVGFLQESAPRQPAA